MDKYGYVMDISKNMQTKLGFSSEVYQQLSQQLSVLDTFKVFPSLENHTTISLQKYTTLMQG